MNKQYLLILFFIAVIIGGCAINTVPAIDSYTINISCEMDRSSEPMVKLSKVLKISIPKSTTAIMSQDILYQEKEFIQNPYAHSRWSDSPNKMLASLFLFCVNKNSVFKSVLPSYSKGKADFLLESTLLEFYHHVNPDGSSEGRVRAGFYLIESQSGEVVAINEFYSKVDAETLDAKGGVRALNEASKLVAISLTQWLSSLEGYLREVREADSGWPGVVDALNVALRVADKSK